MNSQTDIAIIGGGLMGLCSAYYLADSGHSVTILEKDTIGAGASSGNAGYISPSHFIPLANPGALMMGLKWMLNPESPFYVKPTLEPERVRFLLQFAANCNGEHVAETHRSLFELLIHSLNLSKEMVAKEGYDVGLTTNGLYQIYRNPKSLEHEKHVLEMSTELGYPARMYTAEEIREREPDLTFDIIGASHYELDLHLTPHQWLDALKETLTKQGVTILENCAVTAIDRDSSWQIRTSESEMQAKNVVISAGSWSTALAKKIGFRLPVQAGKGYSITYQNPNQRSRTPFIMEEARVAVTPMGSSMRFAGTMEISGMNQTINPARIRGIKKGIQTYLPEFDIESETVEPWVGMRPLSPDGLPIISRVPNQDGLFVATGHAMLGVSLASVTGKLISQLVLGQQPDLDMSRFLLSRFI